MMPISPPRIAVYDRYSTSLLPESAIAERAYEFGALVDFLGGTVVETYLDPELSGYRRNRPALRRMLQSMKDGEVDIVVCDSLDRLDRDAEDVAWLGKKFAFDRVKLHTVSEGQVDEIKFAVAGAARSDLPETSHR